MGEDYAARHELWRMLDLKPLRGRQGTIVRILPPVFEVLFDRKHPRGRDVMVTFHDSACLERVPKRKR